MLVIPTGGGKTVIFCNILRRHRGYAVVIAHRQELLSQISLSLAENGVYHRLCAPQSVIREIVRQHVIEYGDSFYDSSAKVIVAGVDTLKNRQKEQWIKQVTLWVVDEGHHLLQKNKWGKVIAFFPHARGLAVTAHPERADGFGLGREYDGLIDKLIVGPCGRELIDQGYLSDYIIRIPPSNLHLEEVPIGSTGDLVKPKMITAVKKAKLVGSVIDCYRRFASGLLGITFAADIEEAQTYADGFNAAGIAAALITAKTPLQERMSMLRDFRARRIMQLVNVDIFGEGFDLPSLGVVSFARPTASRNLYCLDPETEILTPEGWKGSRDLNSIRRVSAYDATTGRMKVKKVTSTLWRKLYEGERMYGIQGPHLDILVSGQHDMLIKNKGRCVKEVAEKTADRKSLFRIPVSAEGSYRGSGLTLNEIHLLGWYLSDGYINRKTNAMVISQAANKFSHIQHIRETLINCGLKFGEHIVHRKNVPKTHHDQHLFSISKGKPRGTQKELRGWGYLEKWCFKSVPRCYDYLTREEFGELLYTLNLGDGVNNHDSLDYVKRTLTITCGGNREMADRIQALCVTRGFRCNLATAHYDGRNAWYILHIRDSKWSSIAGKNVKNGLIFGKKRYRRSRFEKSSAHPDFVWCVGNDLGTLITRRNGKVSIMGNCQQFGRALRIMKGKAHAVIIDHVGNFDRHKFPDTPRAWSLARRERRSRSEPEDNANKTCVNPDCFRIYDAYLARCPYCQHKRVPQSRQSIEHVEGDLLELDTAILAEMRSKIDVPFDPRRFTGAPMIALLTAQKRDREKTLAQEHLRLSIGIWGAIQQRDGMTKSEAYRKFWHKWGVDVETAKALEARPALELNEKVRGEI